MEHNDAYERRLANWWGTLSLSKSCQDTRDIRRGCLARPGCMKLRRHHFHLRTASSCDFACRKHMKLFPQRVAGMDIYKSEQTRPSTRKVPLAVRSGRCALGERCEGLLPGNLVLLDLLVLFLVCLVCLLLVLGDQVVDVGSALSGRDVPGRTGVEDPVAILSAWLFLYI
jgi:hypothetical protein